MKKVLITGAQGFIGKNLVEAYENKYFVSALTIMELNLLDTEAVGEYLKKNEFDVIIHAANYGTCDTKNPEPFKVLSYGLKMFYNLNKYKDYYGKLIYFGSGAEYDKTNCIPYMTETYFGQHIPEDAYGLYKYALAEYAKTAQNIYDLRLFGVCGKYEQVYRFLSSNICRALKGLPLTLSQNAYFDYIYVDDVAGVVEWFMENTPGYAHYNVCRGQHIDLYSLNVMIRDMLCPGRDILVGKEGWKAEYSGNNERLKSEMGEITFTSYREMIQKLTSYYEPIIHTIDETMLP